MELPASTSKDGEVSADGTKKKKLTTFEKGDGRRLVEYLVVVSSVQTDPDEVLDAQAQELKLNTSFDDDDVEVLNEFKPQITARFPFQDHEDNPLVENISLFCHPSGSINLKQQDPMPKVSTHATLPFLHYFKTRKSNSSNQYLSFSD